METVILKDYKEQSAAVAEYAAGYIRSNPDRLICFAAGDTPLGMFAELIALQEKRKVDLSSMYYVGLDEWAGIGYEVKGSCMQVMFDNFYIPAGIPGERIHVFDGTDADLAAQCGAADEWVRAKGGIGLTVLGIGMNGHIGFNEPGAPFSDHSILIDLDASTLNIGPKYFGGASCPIKGISLGSGQLLGADKAVLMANGMRKAEIVKSVVEGDSTTSVPASVMQKHPCCRCYLDVEAASGLR